MTTTKIQLKSHLAEYCIGKWGTNFKEPVHFPANTEIYLTLYSLTIKRPKNCPFDTGNLEVILPVRNEKDEILRVYKNPKTYNYISEKGNKILERLIESLFWAEIHIFIADARHRKGKYIKDAVYEIMCRYKIKSISEDALIKNYQRWRSKINKRERRSYKKQKKVVYQNV